MNRGTGGAQFSPGWYPDGHGVLRYHDGRGWTPHTHPLLDPGDEAAVLVPAPPPLDADHEWSEAPAPRPPDPERGTRAGRRGEPAEASGARGAWVLAVTAVAAVALLFGAVTVVLGAGDPDAVPPPAAGGAPVTGTSSIAPAAASGPLDFGVAPAVVAARLGCVDLRGAERSVPSAAVRYERVTCTFQGTAIDIGTFPSAVDQAAAETALARFLGERGRYAAGPGWIALDRDYLDVVAAALAGRLAGTVRARPEPSRSPSPTQTPTQTPTPAAVTTSPAPPSPATPSAPRTGT